MNKLCFSIIIYIRVKNILYINYINYYILSEIIKY